MSKQPQPSGWAILKQIILLHRVGEIGRWAAQAIADINRSRT
jgi:hypothetical protein